MKKLPPTNKLDLSFLGDIEATLTEADRLEIEESMYHLGKAIYLYYLNSLRSNFSHISQVRAS